MVLKESQRPWKRRLLRTLILQGDYLCIPEDYTFSAGFTLLNVLWNLISVNVCFQQDSGFSYVSGLTDFVQEMYWSVGCSCHEAIEWHVLMVDMRESKVI